MKPYLIPVVWDDGEVAGIGADPQGILRLRQANGRSARDHALLEMAKGAARLPTMTPPFHASPAIDAADAIMLLHELEKHRK